MDLHHQFEIPTSRDQAWQVLLDIPRITPCVPGAELTEVVDERNFKGAAKIKLGPIALSFAGDAEIIEVDDANYSAKLKAGGSDAKGRGNADADIVFRLKDGEGTATLVEVDTSLNLTGTIAQYGRASGLIDEVAKQLIAQFVENLKVEIGAGSSAAPSPGADAASGGAAASGDDSRGEAISGFGILLRALGAMLKRLFGGSKS